MSKQQRTAVLSVLVMSMIALGTAGSALADVVVYAQASHANHRTVEGPGGGTQNFSFGLLAGGGGGQHGFAGIAYFKLPDVLTSADLTDADLQFTLSGLGDSVLGNLDIYGLGYVQGTPSTTVPGSWYFDQADDTRTGNDLGTHIGTNQVTKIADNALLAATTNADGVVHSTTPSQDTTLAAYIRQLYDNGATANDYAIIRFNVDAYMTPGGNQNRYNIGSATSGATPPSQVPVLTMTTDTPSLIDNSGITAIASSQWTTTTPHRLAIQAVNGTGLSGSQFTTTTHSGIPENVWLSGYGSAADQWFRVDLGRIYELDAVKTFNDGLGSRQVTQADIYIALAKFNSGVEDPGNPDDNPENWTLLFENRTFAPYTNGQPSTDILDLLGIHARYYALSIDANGGDTGGLVGLGELQFFGTAIPEPSTLAISLLGLLSLMRRRA